MEEGHRRNSEEEQNTNQPDQPISGLRLRAKKWISEALVRPRRKHLGTSNGQNHSGYRGHSTQYYKKNNRRTSSDVYEELITKERSRDTHHTERNNQESDGEDKKSRKSTSERGEHRKYRIKQPREARLQDEEDR